VRIKKKQLVELVEVVKVGKFEEIEEEWIKDRFVVESVKIVKEEFEEVVKKFVVGEFGLVAESVKVEVLVAAEQTHSKEKELEVIVVELVKKDSPKLVEHLAENNLKKKKTPSLAQEIPP
jgi:hypothetical protein